MFSRFENIEMATPVEIFFLNKAFADDTFEKKVNLSIGVYRGENGKPYVLPVVRQVEQMLADDESLTKEYLSMLGYEKFSDLSVKLVLGETHSAYLEQRAFAIQSLSGTGALRLGADLLNRTLGYNIAYISDPTWENHRLLFSHANFEIRTYRYWSVEKKALDWDGLVYDLEHAPENAVIILHVCCHNPTGLDPTHDQWKEIADIIYRRKLFPFFDFAYHGLATGDLDRDGWAVRHFAELGIELFCAQSYSKTFGLYSERAGNLVVVTKNINEVPIIKGQATLIVRAMYANPPSHGSRIISHILGNPDLYSEWMDNLKSMSVRIIEMRRLLRTALERLGTPGTWDHITSHVGPFTYTGLTEEQCIHIVEKYHIYILKSGRICIGGLTRACIKYVAKAIHETITTIGKQC